MMFMWEICTNCHLDYEVYEDDMVIGLCPECESDLEDDRELEEV